MDRIRFCPDSALGYDREARRPAPGVGLTFDQNYRLAHLPLIAPDHPLAIAAAPGRAYDYGRHPPSLSLVIEIDDVALRASSTFDDMAKQIAASPFAPKVCWPLLERRRHRLHATVAGALSVCDVARLTEPAARAELLRVGPVAVELRGLFTGRINRGRSYLRLYPEERDGRSAFALIQDLLARPSSDIYLVGLYNLQDELDPAEAGALNRIVEAWWSRALLRFEVSRLALLSSSDDLVLDSETVGYIPLIAPCETTRGIASVRPTLP